MLKIAVAGSPLSTPPPGGTVEGIRRARSLGIGALEIEWVQNVPSSPDRMKEIRRAAEENEVSLTVHAPYFVNLNSPEPAKLEASKQRILRALSMAELAGAVSVCVHAAFYLGLEPTAAYANVRATIDEIMAKKNKFFPHVNLALETMGKPTQFGTLEEVLEISREFGIYPCIDAAHLHARYQGKINSIEEWNDMLDTYEKYLGKGSLNKVHFHYSGIAYGPGGERKHLPFKDSDAKWKDYASTLKERDVGGILVCESPAMEEDTLLLAKTYASSGARD